jgi:hypothetical protein
VVTDLDRTAAVEVQFTLLHNRFRLLPAEGDDMNKRAEEMDFNFNRTLNRNH